MDRIAARARVSKQTVYNHFGCKADLFAAIVRKRCDEMTHTLVFPKSGDTAEVLRQLARQFIEITLTPEAIALYRTIICESARCPELGAAFYAAGPDRITESLAEYLNQRPGQSRMNLSRARILAEQFFAMLHGHLQTRALLGLSTAHPTQRNAYLDQAVAMLLAAGYET